MIPAAATLATLARETAEEAFDGLTTDCTEPMRLERMTNMPDNKLPRYTPVLVADPTPPHGPMCTCIHCYTPTPPLPHAAPAPAPAAEAVTGGGAAMRELVAVLDAHTVLLESCGRDGQAYCDCLDMPLAKAREVLAALDQPQEADHA